MHQRQRKQRRHQKKKGSEGNDGFAGTKGAAGATERETKEEKAVKERKKPAMQLQEGKEKVSCTEKEEENAEESGMADLLAAENLLGLSPQAHTRFKHVHEENVDAF